VRRVFRSLIGGVLVSLLALSPSLRAAAPAAAATAPEMGVVLQAEHASVDSGAATVGSTVFDGDQLQAEKDGGLLRVRFGSSQAALMAGAAAVVHRSPDGFSANLTRGQVVLASGQGQKFSLLADGATIQPSTSAPTVAQVTWVGPKELILTSRKGALQVSMGDEVQTVADGSSYRMLIDPVSAAAAAPAPGPTPRPQTQAGGHNAFILVLIVAAAALVTVGIILAVESPSSPSAPTGLSASTH
jgi:hypothetical protein